MHRSGRTEMNQRNAAPARWSVPWILLAAVSCSVAGGDDAAPRSLESQATWTASAAATRFAGTPPVQRGKGMKLKVSSNGRHFVDQGGRPFFYLGDTAW